MPYFHISTGLRGCYMPDSCYVIKADTRRELKAVIEYEANTYRDAGFIGANKKAIAALAANAWRNRGESNAALPYVLPLAPEHAPRNYCHGIFAGGASRGDYLEYVKESN